MSSSLQNLLSPLRTGYIKLERGGKELFGTVIKSGLIDKTVTVRVTYHFWHKKYRHFFTRSSNFLTHDEENFSNIYISWPIL